MYLWCNHPYQRVVTLISEEGKKNDEKMYQSMTVTVKWRHFVGRKTIMIYSAYMIAQKSTSNVVGDPKEWSHLSVVREKNKYDKYNNQRQWQWNYAIMIGEKKMMINSDNIISQQSTYNAISKPNKQFHSWEMRKQRKTTKNNNQQWWWWNDTIVVRKKITLAEWL